MHKYSTVIGRKLLSYILAFSFIITLAAFLYILLSDYQRGVSSYDRNLEQIRNSYQQSISYSLWNFDSGQIEAQLLGILNFPGVVYVYIENNGKLLHSAGNLYNQAERQYQFSLHYTSAGQEYPLGTLHISLDYTGLYDEIKEKTINILLTQFIKTFSISVFVLFIVHQVITRRLGRMADWARNFSLNNLSTPLRIQSSRVTPDELTTVADAINQMRHTLQQDMEQQEQSRRQLENIKEQLSIAINNAAIGFCTYSPVEDKVSCNAHFASRLAATEYELESLQHPLDKLLQRLEGPQAVPQRERINQLLQGRSGRIQDTFQLRNFHNELCYLEMTLQTTRYHDNRPQEILICMADRTREQEALIQARELTVSLENKVTQRTEDLYNEQLRSHATIEQLQKELKQLSAEDEKEQQKKINELLLSQLVRLQQISAPLPAALPAFTEYLQVSVQERRSSINLARYTRLWLEEADLSEDKITLHLPFSLIVEEDPALIRFLFRHLILDEPALASSHHTDITLRLTADQVEFTARYQPDNNRLPELTEDQQTIASLCSHLISLRLHGSSERQLLAGSNQLQVRFALAMGNL